MWTQSVSRMPLGGGGPHSCSCTPPPLPPLLLLGMDYWALPLHGHGAMHGPTTRRSPCVRSRLAVTLFYTDLALHFVFSRVVCCRAMQQLCHAYCPARTCALGTAGRRRAQTRASPSPCMLYLLCYGPVTLSCPVTTRGSGRELTQRASLGGRGHLHILPITPAPIYLSMCHYYQSSIRPALCVQKPPHPLPNASSPPPPPPLPVPASCRPGTHICTHMHKRAVNIGRHWPKRKCKNRAATGCGLCDLSCMCGNNNASPLHDDGGGAGGGDDNVRCVRAARHGNAHTPPCYAGKAAQTKPRTARLRGGMQR